MPHTELSFILCFLLIVTEICGISLCKLFGSIGYGLKLSCEEAKCFGLVYEAKSDVHLSQNVGGKMHCSLASEDGLIDIGAVCRLLSEYGYDGLVVLEVGTHHFESKEALDKLLKTLEL